MIERVAGDVGRLAELGDPRRELLVAGWLAGFRSARVRRAYDADLAAFSGWCRARGLDVLDAPR